jgi:GNAT superfamily N-acetyltransferase
MPASMPRMAEAGWALAAEDEGGLVGYAMVDLELGEVDAVFVDPAHQGRGIGRRLLRALEEMAAAHGYGRVFLTASLNAVPFYRSAGYDPVRDELHDHRSGLKIPAVYMEKHLARG